MVASVSAGITPGFSTFSKFFGFSSVSFYCDLVDLIQTHSLEAQHFSYFSPLEKLYEVKIAI